MIAAISSVRNEAGIIAQNVRHLEHFADVIVISDGHSTDGTRDIIADLPVVVFDQDGPFDQAAEILKLTRYAKSQGADWVVPFDADEFWIGLDQLRDLPPEVGKVGAAVYGHTDWEFRHTNPKPLRKVCYRDATSVAWGNHDADCPGEARDLLEIRELQYQSFEHFLAKIDKARELYESSDFPEVYGSHMRALVAMSDGQRVAEWARLMATPTVFDPIQLRGAVA